MRTFENTNTYTGQQTLAIISGWQPTLYPVHRALEAEAAEQIDLAERDFTARVAFQRRAAR